MIFASSSSDLHIFVENCIENISKERRYVWLYVDARSNESPRRAQSLTSICPDTSRQ